MRVSFWHWLGSIIDLGLEEEVTSTILFFLLSEEFKRISVIAAQIKFSLLSNTTLFRGVFVKKSKCLRKKAWTEAKIPHGPPSF